MMRSDSLPGVTNSIALLALLVLSGLAPFACAQARPIAPRARPAREIVEPPIFEAERRAR